MCLYVKNKINLTESVTVYKVVRKNSEGNWTGPYYGYEYRKQYPCTAYIRGEVDLSGRLAPSFEFPEEFKCLRIENGFHSFPNITDARKLLQSLCTDYSSLSPTLAIGKFTIPKTAEVYAGTFDVHWYGNLDCYASNEIMFNGIVETI